MGRSNFMRPQAMVVILVVLVLLSRGEGRFISDAHPQGEGVQDQALISTPTPTVVARTEPTEIPPATPTATSTPVPTFTPTPPPTPTPVPTATPEPTQTPIPEPTERPAPPPSGLDDVSRIVTQPETGRQEIALTFDAGQGRGYTMEILDLLDEYGVAATFGVTGEWATAHPDLLQAIVERGHQVMNHSYSHRSFTGASTGGVPIPEEQVRAEVLDTEQAIWENSGGYEVGPYFRFPYGDYSAGNLSTLKQLGYDYMIWWGCDSKAWMGHTAADIIQECGVEKMAPGLIVLLHVDPQPDFEALPELIERYQAAGYDLVTVEQLIQP